MPARICFCKCICKSFLTNRIFAFILIVSYYETMFHNTKQSAHPAARRKPAVLCNDKCMAAPYTAMHLVQKNIGNCETQ